MNAAREIGILQGRLGGGPVSDEAKTAAVLGFDAIELLVREGDTAQHAIWTDTGIQKLKEIRNQTGISFPSVNADHFKLGGLTHADFGVREAAIKDLKRLVQQVASLGGQRILLPFFDAGELRMDRDFEKLIDSLRQAMPAAKALSITLSVETTLPSKDVCRILDAVPGLCAYYDIGNAASFGFDLLQELRDLGGRISGIHVKDRLRGGPNVPMGTGAVPFSQVIPALQRLPYGGPWILETTPGDQPIEFARKHLAFLKGHMQ
jgi:L-ribulose-5-phosphate 3-epimerase